MARRTCLFSSVGHDIKSVLRREDDVGDEIRRIWNKRDDRFSEISAGIAGAEKLGVTVSGADNERVTVELIPPGSLAAAEAEAAGWRPVCCRDLLHRTGSLASQRRGSHRLKLCRSCR